MKMSRKLVFVLGFFMLVLLPQVVFALTVPNQNLFEDGLVVNPVTSVRTVNDLFILVVKVLRIIYTVIFIIAAIFGVMTAFDYINSNGDADTVKEVRQKLIYIMVGIAVALLAVSLATIVNSAITT